MTECYKYKDIKDINRKFDNNLNIVIEMPKYHTDVFWDLGHDISVSSSFMVAQQRLAKNESNSGPLIN